MKVKIGVNVFDSNYQPIMIILSSEDKECISNMGGQTKFCAFPDNCKSADIIEFMEDV